MSWGKCSNDNRRTEACNNEKKNKFGFDGIIFTSAKSGEKYYLGTGGSLDVPISHPGVVHVGVILLGQPLHGWVLTQEASAGAEVLPGETGVSLVVILEGVVQLPAPVNGVDNLGLSVKHVGRDVDC